MSQRSDAALVITAFVLSAIAVWVLTDTLIPDRGSPRAVVKEVEELVRSHGVVQPADEDLALAAARGIADSLDPWSVALSPADREKDRFRHSGHYAGVGIVLEEDETGLVILQVIRDGPAARAGVCELEHVLAVDGVEVSKGRAVEETRGRLRGEKGSRVKLCLADTAGVQHDVELSRDDVTQPTSWGCMVEDTPGLGVLVIETFYENTAAQAAEVLETLAAAGMRGLVIDLRDNPGGLLNSPAEVARLFLGGRKLIVSTRGARTNGELRAEETAPWQELPLVVMMDGRTASSAEVLAAALQDHARAPLVGERSFGKGVVQQALALDSLPGAALRITTAHYFAPSGRCIERSLGLTAGQQGRGGLQPDLAVACTPAERGAADRLRDRWRYSAAVRARLAAREQLADAPLAAALALLQGQPPADRRF